MDSDDDFELFSSAQEPSPREKKLKRLKKSFRTTDDPLPSSPEVRPPSSITKTPSNPDIHQFEEPNIQDLDVSDEPVKFSAASGGFHKEFESLEESIAQDPHISKEPVPSGAASEGSDKEFESSSEFGEVGTKRALEFDSGVSEFGERGEVQSTEIEEESGNLEVGDSVKKRPSPEELEEDQERKRKKKKRVTSDDGIDALPLRMTQKERRARLEELRAESQRLLRETRDAGFKPLPLVQKPISSILEKIRKRKLEVSKKSVRLNSNSIPCDSNDSLRELMVDSDPEDLISEDDNGTLVKSVSRETMVEHVDATCSFNALSNNEANASGRHSIPEDISDRIALSKENNQTFRAPIDDTQDLFPDSQTNGTDKTLNEEPSSPLEDILAPSKLVMNLKLDSAPPDELSDDQEDNDKENIHPDRHRSGDSFSSPRGDPVKAFVDEEAEEEDDSDNDLMRFQEDEDDEDNEDVEELNAMIATDYKERPIDTERRNELHQKWLEQQDASGTENLLQRLKYGSKPNETSLFEEEEDKYHEEDQDSRDDIGDDTDGDLVPTNIVRMNLKKAKEMIPQMFSEKDDAYISSDDEETEKKIVKQCLSEKVEEKNMILSPAEDENSQEVFGRIKKLNVLPDLKKRPKASAFPDTLLTRGNKNSSSKSSFLGRGSSSSLPTLQKRGPSRVRSFIFERDDSNSRSTASISEDIANPIQKETRPPRNTSSKIINSQPKSFSQKTKISIEVEDRTSLFEILKRSSVRSESCNVDQRSHETHSMISAFKLEKPRKREGRA